MSSRKMLIAGNWKMNGLQKDGVELATAVAKAVNEVENPKCEFLVCPPMTLITSVVNAVEGSKVAVGSQDCHFNVKGAHTGDTSPVMIKDAGCEYAIVGHSERRTDYKESNELICKKSEAAYEAGLKAVICIGETEAERDAGKTVEVCKEQILGSVPANATAENTVIAYEPVWAIGTGKTPTPADVQEVHAEIRKVVAEKLGTEIASKMRILYGGSVKPSNAADFLPLEDVDGALIGGASLKVEDFMGIAKVCL